MINFKMAPNLSYSCNKSWRECGYITLH